MVKLQAKPLTREKLKKTLEALFKRIEFDKTCPESLQNFANLVKKKNELFSSYIQYTNSVIREESIDDIEFCKHKDTVDDIQRLTSYKDDYIG